MRRLLVKKRAKEQKRVKISRRITNYMAIALFIVFSALFVVVATITSDDIKENQQKQLELLAQKNAAIVEKNMESLIDKQAVLIDTIKNIVHLKEDEKAIFLKDIILQTKEKEANILSLFFVAEPNYFFENSPEGYSVFATDNGMQESQERFQFVNEELYNKTKETKATTVVDPFKKTIDGKEYMVMTVLLPILDENNNLVGMVGSNIDTEWIDNLEFDTGGYSSFSNQIVCGHQTVITHSTDKERVGRKFIEVSPSTNAQLILDSAKDANTLNMLDTDKDGKKYRRSYTPFYVGESKVVWLSGTSISNTEMTTEFLKRAVAILAVSVIGFVALYLFVFSVLRRALAPIQEIEDAAKKLAEGKLDLSIAYESNNELGSLADSLRTSVAIMYTYVKDIDRAMKEMANGNFNIEAGQPFIGDFKGIEDSIGAFIMDISKTLTTIKESSKEVSYGSEQVADAAQILADGASEQSLSVQDLLAAVSDISLQVHENSKNAEEATSMANEATAAIASSNVQMHGLRIAMEDISEKSEEISKIIKTIEDIAFQTNILSLNASVEAARAGAAGTGFVVVANEVRDLANKSNEAAKNITLLISKTVTSVDNGVKITNATAKDLEEAVEGAKATTAVISNIAVATGEQAKLLEKINVNVEKIENIVQSNSAASEETAATSEELATNADLMANLVSKFELKEI